MVLHMGRFESMSASRLRFVLHVLIYALGLFAPWDRMVPAVSGLSTWLVVAAAMARQGWTTFTGATVAVLVVATVLACAAAALRTWAAAWVIDHGMVRAGTVQGRTSIEEGPYRWIRHPLYVGILLHTVALAVLMPPAGAVFAIVATALLDGWLMRNEKASLRARTEAGNEAYQGEVPAMPRAGVGMGGRAAWGLAVFLEVYFWGVAVSFASLGWRYNAFLLQRCVLVSFGLGLVVRALLPKEMPAA